MKLYTEEQVLKAMNDYANTSSDTNDRVTPILQRWVY